MEPLRWPRSSVEGRVEEQFTSTKIETMAARLIEISRDGVALGMLPETEARELLAAGFLKPTDHFRAEAGADLKPLFELVSPPTAADRNTSWLAKAKDSLVSAGSSVADTAGEFASQAWRLTRATQSKAVEIPDRLLSAFLPQIQGILNGLLETKPFQAVRNGVRDDDLMQKVFGATYDCLPKPVCRFVSETQFIAFCMKHRGQLLGDSTTPKLPPPA